MASLIVPSQYAQGKPNPRPVSNPFARGRRAPWKGVPKNAGGMVEHPGRNYGATVGGWIDDLTATRKIVALCEGCQSKFYYRRVQYHRDERYGSSALATCDGCRDYNSRCRLYIPEENLVESSGPKPGQCWVPR